VPALYSSMNESVELVGGPALMRNSLILIGFTLRTFSTAISDCLPPVLSVQLAFATRSPLNAAVPDVTLKVALTLVFGARSANVFDAPTAPVNEDVHCLGTAILNWSPVTAAPVVFVNVTVMSCDDPGEKVCRFGGAAVAEEGAMLNRATSYLA